MNFKVIVKNLFLVFILMGTWSNISCSSGVDSGEEEKEANSQALTNSYLQDGYCVIKALFNPQEVKEISEIADDLYKKAEHLAQDSALDSGGTENILYEGTQFVVSKLADGRPQVKRIVWAGSAKPRLLELSRQTKLLNRIASLLGMITADHLINQLHYKMPGDEVMFDWHQDEENRLQFDNDWNGGFVQSILAIDRMTKHNGAINIVKGSHKKGLLNLKKKDKDDAIFTELQEKSFLLTMEAGDVVLMDPFLVHASFPNLSSEPRRVLVNGFAKPGANTKPYPGATSCQTISLKTGEILYSHLNERYFPKGTFEVKIEEIEGINTKVLENIAAVVEKSIVGGGYPGAVVYVCKEGKPLYEGVFGSRSVLPTIQPMTADTIFDLASLTKVVATATSIMQLVAQEKLSLDDEVHKYWQDFANNGKQAVTIHHLLTHTSGLSALPEEDKKLQGEESAVRYLERIALEAKPGEKFTYSDLGFMALGYLVKIITGEPLDQYARKNIFEPIGMTDTFFSPSPEERLNRVAPSEVVAGELRWGKVHDPRAYSMGGVAGHAGLFSTAKDLANFAQVLLDKGQHQDRSEILPPLYVKKMTSPQTPREMKEVRGLGWDIDSLFPHHGKFPPLSFYWHTGWTGTSIWSSPSEQISVIILTSRTHPTPAKVNPLLEDRLAIFDIVADSLRGVGSSSGEKALSGASVYGPA